MRGALQKPFNKGTAHFGAAASSELIRASRRLEQLLPCALITNGGRGNFYAGVNTRRLEEKDATYATADGPCSTSMEQGVNRRGGAIARILLTHEDAKQLLKERRPQDESQIFRLLSKEGSSCS